ncbi:uncharacterized protein BDZ99DRAFT_86274 [Mytilinidion resinicola]|uniref:Uncharacterized protein n=1 Tax=Mytilinidion resinicola TaxID=574789 RepID=A0A6A6YE72_9PEZI|nr:uncharacterized protein BDZ99DRAFT_86274 [Mytilinidion resinicola]KAF2806833.1 hypothetical protein BDZ99DRAFT_86274 [Mytilinidion resinicola]
MPTQSPFASSASTQDVFPNTHPGFHGAAHSSPFQLQHETFMQPVIDTASTMPLQDLSAAWGQPYLAPNDLPLPSQAGGGHLDAW